MKQTKTGQKSDNSRRPKLTAGAEFKIVRDLLEML